MLSHGFVRFPVFEPNRSRVLPRVTIAVAAVASLAMVLSQAPTWLTALFGLLAAAIVLRMPSLRVASVRRRYDGRWVVTVGDGRRFIGHLAPSCVIHRWLAVLVIQDGWRRTAIALPRDTLSEDAHRRLRVSLRWMADGQSGRSTVFTGGRPLSGSG